MPPKAKNAGNGARRTSGGKVKEVPMQAAAAAPTGTTVSTDGEEKLVVAEEEVEEDTDIDQDDDEPGDSDESNDEDDVDTITKMMMTALAAAMSQMKKKKTVKSDVEGKKSKTSTPVIPTTASVRTAREHKKKPPTFNGNKSNITTYKTFKMKFKQYLDYCNITDVHSVLSDCLTEDASLWYMTYAEAHPEVEDLIYDELMAILDSEYMNPLAASKYLYEYQQMKPIQNESIRELATRINNLATQAGITLRSDPDKKNKLFHLLPLYLQEANVASLLNENINYESFITYVTQVKEINDTRFQQRKARNPHYNTVQNVTSHENNNNEGVRNINSHNTKFKSFKPKANLPCEYCQRTNHGTVFCSRLLRDYTLKQPEAIKFWREKQMDEKLVASNKNNGTANTAIDTKEVVHNIGALEKSKLASVDGSLNNYPVKGILIDEGSSVSLISVKLYNELLHHSGRSLQSTLLTHNLPKLTQADGNSTISVVGIINLELRFDDTRIGYFPFIVVNSLSHDVIIGRDITAPTNLSIINDNGTKLIQGLNKSEPNLKLSDTVKVFKIRDRHIENSNRIIANINAVIKTTLEQSHPVYVPPITAADEVISLPEHLKDIVIPSDLGTEHRNKLVRILVDFQDVFYKPGDPITKLNTHIKHSIRLKDNAEPVQAKLYSLPQAHRQAITQQVNSWLKLQIVKPSYSPWSATCVVVDKKDQALGRVCGNFQPLNALTVNDAYPIKRIEDQKENFTGCFFYSCIDLKDAYLQVELDEKSKELTAIVTHDGLFQFERMIQGLKTAPATFHRIIDDAFKDVIDKCLAPYFDDLTVHSKNIDEHLSHLIQTFTIMRKFGFKAKASKVQLCVKELSWLGFKISNGEIRPDAKLVAAITKLVVPRNVNEVRMVTGLFNFYRSFIPKFAERCAPLDKLKRADVDFKWETEQQTAFDDLKSSLMTYPVLRLPDVNKPFILDTDASRVGIGGILQQEDEMTKKNYVVSYFSRRITDAEKKLGVTDLEALALRDSIRKFRRYLIGRKFVVYVDHISLTYLKNLSTLTGKLGRISIDLQQYDYDIKYKPGSQHTNVDCLSRMSNGDEVAEEAEVNNISTRNSSSLLAFKQVQAADAFIVSVIDYLNGNEAYKLDTELENKIKNFLNQRNLKFKVQDGILSVLNTQKKNAGYRVVIPDDNIFMKLQLTQSVHNASHCGAETLYKLLQSKFYWSAMKEYLTNFVDACTVCQKTKRNYHGDLTERKIVLDQSVKNFDETKMVEPFSQITIDHLDLPQSESGYTCVLVIIDRATRLIKAIPCKKHDSMEFIQHLIEEWIFNYGVPSVILSDNGKAFVSSLVKQLYNILDIEQVLSTAWNPQSHGLVERANQNIQKILRSLIEAHHDGLNHWDKYLNQVVFVINTTVNKVTGFSPYELVYGRKAAYPIDRLLYDDEIFNSVGEYMQNLMNKQKINYALVHKRLLDEKQKHEQYNIENQSKLRVYEVGDLVYKVKNDRKNKLDILYEGPYIIMKKINDLCYEIRLLDSDKAPLVLVNIRQLKPFINESDQIETANSANNTIDDIMKEFRSMVKLRKPIEKDDYLTDAEFDAMINGYD